MENYKISSQSGHYPVVQQWQNGWEIPVNIEKITIESEDGKYDMWEYQRVVVNSLNSNDVLQAVNKDFDGNNNIYQEAMQQIHGS
jgi:hypothetical protein